MKRNKLFIFFPSLFLIVLIMLPLISHDVFSSEILLDETQTNFSLRVDSDLNETSYYVSVSNQIIVFSIQCNSWGIEFGDGYKGLLIELIFDVNDSTLNSWLILSGDTSIHHFTSEIELDGVIQIKFSSLKVDSINVELVLTDDYPVWTYETHINAFDNVFFGVERNAEFYLSIEKIVLHLATRNVVSFNYTCEIYNELDQSIVIYSGNFSYSDLELVEIITEEGLFEEHWYKLRFYTDDYSNSTQIKCSIFYDHYQTENIGRIFLRKSNQVINDIPIDSLRSTPSFYWTIFDPFIPPPPPPPIPNLLIIIMIVILAIFSFIFIVIVVTGIRVNYKKKRMNLHSTVVLPSDKYYQMQEQRAKYSPAQVYGVNFAEKILDYNVETSDEIKVTCSICLQIIDNQEHLIRCPSCDIAFHKNHLYQWIVGNGNCPACKSRLKITKY
ncbi:MAG: E3 ubiquitin protein ligase [Asgard group archaeon]|nr:E3 ubiquitin protein ligase [Asgard group archaeon]